VLLEPFHREAVQAREDDIGAEAQEQATSCHPPDQADVFERTEYFSISWPTGDTRVGHPVDGKERHRIQKQSEINGLDTCGSPDDYLPL